MGKMRVAEQTYQTGCRRKVFAHLAPGRGKGRVCSFMTLGVSSVKAFSGHEPPIILPFGQRKGYNLLAPVSQCNCGLCLVRKGVNPRHIDY